MTVAEKRKFRRVPMDAQVQAEAGKAPYLVQALNISIGGILLRSSHTLESGEKMRLHFTLPGTGHPIHVTGTVQHVSPGAFMGVRFNDLSPEDLALIEKLVDETS